MGNYYSRHACGIGKKVIKLLKVTLSVCFLLNVFWVIIQIEWWGAGLKFFQELISEINSENTWIIGEDVLSRELYWFEWLES